MDIHNYEKRYETGIEQVKTAKISAKNKELILAFTNDLVLEGISKPRLAKYLNTLKILAIAIKKDFDTADINDIKKIVGSIQQRTDYSPWTKQAYKVIIRRFYRWVCKTKDYPPIVDWITIGIKRCEKPLPSEGNLLFEQEIQQLIQTADHVRDKALVSMLWESGTRISELGNLKLNNVEFDEHGILISVRGKTGSRKVRMMASTQYLSTWISMHPLRNNKLSPLWINVGTTHHNQQMSYAAIRTMLIRLFQKAGISKECNPHLFRHSRATFMAHHLTEFQMNQYFGWIQGSKMPSTYVHMSGRDVDNAILKMNGYNEEIKKEESKLIPHKCSRCDSINNNENKFCFKCGGILDLRYAMELQEKENIRNNADELMNRFMRDKDVQALLKEKIALLKA